MANGKTPRAAPQPAQFAGPSKNPAAPPAQPRAIQPAPPAQNLPDTTQADAAMLAATREISGLENVTPSDLLIPRLTILQKLSPQLNASRPEFIAGAKVGQFCDVGTNEVWDQLLVLPCYYSKVYIQWGDRRSGRGLVRNYGQDNSILDQCQRDENRRFVLPNGDYIAETAQFYVLNLTSNRRRSFIPLAVTQLKAARRWLTQITSERMDDGRGNEVPTPLYYRAWAASTRPTSNAQGDWLLWYLDSATEVKYLDPSGGLIREAVAFAKQIAGGLAIGDMGREDSEPVEDESNEEHQFGRR